MSSYFQFREVGFAATVLVLLAGAPAAGQTSGDASAVEPSQTSATYGDWELRCRQLPVADAGDTARELCERHCHAV